jgi:hypothetical protein
MSCVDRPVCPDDVMTGSMFGKMSVGVVHGQPASRTISSDMTTNV